MLIRRSQLQPAMKATAAGGKRIATWEMSEIWESRSRGLTRMSKISEPLTIVEDVTEDGGFGKRP